VPAKLNDLGRCACPAGAARFGSPNTDNTPILGAKVGSNSGAAAKAGKGAKGRVDVACTPCAADAYATIARPVAISKCTVCPTGTTTNGDIGSTTCYVQPGQFFNVATQAAQACPADQFCLGGDIADVGRLRTPCPIMSGTQGAVGAADIGGCIMAAGVWYNANINSGVLCPQGFTCYGGSILDAPGPVQCPGGTNTANVGAAYIRQCVTPPGTYFSGGVIYVCPARATPGTGVYCLGGSITGDGWGILSPCPNNLCSNQGTARAADCVACV
jgi:hypothetical protein